MFSIDGAQLYAHKASDVWIWIWVLLDLPPELRFKKEYVIPAAVIPGPNKPKNLDSFLFVGLHHIAALQRDGLVIWNALDNTTFTSHPWLHLGTGDGPGSAQVSGLVPHNGARGCRLRCNVIGRHKPTLPTYYPALLKPYDYNVAGCDHPDVPASSVAVCTSEDYRKGLNRLLAAKTDTEYEDLRKETGIVKPTIVLGLSKVLDAPDLFPADLMHHACLNLPELFLALWRGTLACDYNDSKSLWDWSVLKGAVWKAHGREVAATSSYLPGSFGGSPRNIAKKVSSGYKAAEFEIWFYVCGPALLYGVLPERYWRHYCKLVMGMRLAHQRSLTVEQVQLIDKLFISFYKEYELMYYQRHPGRLHFVRQSVHALLHIAAQIFRIAPPVYCAQWTMERMIGELGRLIKLHSKAFENLSERTVLRAQVSAFHGAYIGPETKTKLPRGSLTLGGGFVLLTATDEKEISLGGYHGEALRSFWELHQPPGSTTPLPMFRRWARLRLPNDQIVRSLWKEGEKALQKVRIARNIKVIVTKLYFLSPPTELSSQIQLASKIRFAEVQFFLRLEIQGVVETLALVSLYSQPNEELLQHSYGTVVSCRYQGVESLRVVPITDIISVVGMIPHPATTPANIIEPQGSFYVAEKLGLESSLLRGSNPAHYVDEE